MGKARVQLWTAPPRLAIPEDPATLYTNGDLWLAYEITAEPRGKTYAIVRFRGVIDHRLSPINDEGIGQHPYASLGLQWYCFNEVLDSAETRRWSVLKARHWIVTFKDCTLDVLGDDAFVVESHLQSDSAFDALLAVISTHPGPTTDI